ncbi:MAG TPA: FAD-binding protein [Anditalea sp.]|nr:FAD-binding protein [Anditalea sp.]
MFSFKISKEIKTDVLIIGAGAAGIRTSIALSENNITSLLVSKREFGDAHTWMAAGGINASLGSLDEEDRWEIHAADTLREGHFINDPNAVEAVCKNAPDAIKELDDWGCPFNKTEDGKINQRFFGAQSFRRTCFVGDKTGRAILDTLVEQAKKRDIPCHDGIYIFQIVKKEGKVLGALGLNKKNKEVIFYKSPYVVLAAGGYASIYNRSSARKDENIGDTIYLAYEAGARLMDMEMVQFHPTGMVKPEDYLGKLVTEAVRGEGGHLLNRHKDRFMTEYSPEMKELDARDEVARAIAKEIFNGNGTENNGVYLDISHKDEEFIKSRLPKMYDRFKELGIDISKEPMEVSPTSHYSMGGVEVNFETGATNIEGLYAVGEATSGLHGANRLGGNSLIETVVLGKLSGENIARNYISGSKYDAPTDFLKDLEGDYEKMVWVNKPLEIINKVKNLMWEHAGILRNEELLKEGASKLENIKSEYQDKTVSLEELSFEEIWQNLDLKNVLLSSELVLRSAIERKESRGAHYREDYTDTSEEFKLNILCSKNDNGKLSIDSKSVGQPSKGVQKALDENHSLDYHQLE